MVMPPAPGWRGEDIRRGFLYEQVEMLRKSQRAGCAISKEQPD
ncbi:hypothetical protein HMPREF0731_4388 [Pseudoroseomonas cervicalis ATCC 49957]|uniref:Uncharacterized protein n=1 Tax=Pseudoroseomonas cervicalis ATCC 49957 TaxID=525371 RepID=D5RTH6_9PROT|nr:hypothetical protein HMPREF0731_4388 [Pseudoroseomonas cervicalis ATCC 49957]